MSFKDPKCIRIGRENGKYFAKSGDAYYRIGGNETVDDLINFIETYRPEELILFHFTQIKDKKWHLVERKKIVSLLKEPHENEELNPDLSFFNSVVFS